MYIMAIQNKQAGRCANIIPALIINDTFKGSIAMTEPIVSDLNPGCKAYCLNCHKELIGKNQVKYCSKRCELYYRTKKANEKNTRQCLVCGIIFVAQIHHKQDDPNHKNEGTYCSKACLYYGRKIGSFCDVWFNTCLVCGKVFTTRLKRDWCSVDCNKKLTKKKAKESNYNYSALKKILISHNCKECGILFTPKYGDKKRLFCSAKCGKKYTDRDGKHNRSRARKHGVKYEYTNSNKVFERDGWKCQICGKTTPRARRGSRYPNAPEIDHRVPISKGGDHLYSNIQCACRACNGKKSNHRTVGQLPLFNINV